MLFHRFGPSGEAEEEAVETEDREAKDRGLHVLPRIAEVRNKRAANKARVGTARQQRRRLAMKTDIDLFMDSLNLSDDDVLAIQRHFSEERANVNATFVSKM